MFRISKVDQTARSLLTLEGNLSKDCVETVERCCQQAMARKVPVLLYLRDVTDVDASARALLRRLADAGVRLRGNGVYTEHILRAINALETHPARSTGS